MVNFQLDTRHQEIIEKYRDFSNRWIVPNRMKYDESAVFPWDIVKAAYDEKIINASLPVEYGGHGHNILDSALASEELGYGCTGIGICYTVYFRNDFTIAGKSLVNKLELIGCSSDISTGAFHRENAVSYSRTSGKGRISDISISPE